MTTSTLTGLDLSRLNIADDDKTTRKLMMLIEGAYRIGVAQSVQKYGYTEQRYYQLLKAFKEQGIDGICDKKRGPKTNSVRTGQVEKQIIRLRLLDPKTSAAVITQKLNQMGYTIRQRSVERTITGYRLQKKLYTLDPATPAPQAELRVQRTKRKRSSVKVTLRNNERHVRGQLAGKVSDSHLGQWLLIPEYLQLGPGICCRACLGATPTRWLLTWACIWPMKQRYVWVGCAARTSCAIRGSAWPVSSRNEASLWQLTEAQQLYLARFVSSPILGCASSRSLRENWAIKTISSL